MGPMNISLVKLYQAEKHLREAQARLDAVTKNVRLQHRKVEDLTARSTSVHTDWVKAQAKAAELELEVKAKDERIEQLRTQQAAAQTNREYQAFLVEINTLKVDKGKIEEEALNVLEKVEKYKAEHVSLVALKEQEIIKLSQMQGEIDVKVADLQVEVDALRPDRDSAKNDVPQKAYVVFERLAQRYEGDAMEPIDKPHPKREEYIAAICNIDLTVDIYNRLHTRDELVYCPGCGRILFIPLDLTPEKAVHKPKEKKTRKPKDIAAPVQRQTLASSVVTSVDQEEPEEPVTSDQTPPVV